MRRIPMATERTSHERAELMLEWRDVLRKSGLCDTDDRVVECVDLSTNYAAPLRSTRFGFNRELPICSLHGSFLDPETNGYSFYLINGGFDSITHQHHEGWWILRYGKNLKSDFDYYQWSENSEGWTPALWSTGYCPKGVFEHCADILLKARICEQEGDAKQLIASAERIPRSWIAPAYGLPYNAMKISNTYSKALQRNIALFFRPPSFELGATEWTLYRAYHNKYYRRDDTVHLQTHAKYLHKEERWIASDGHTP